MVRRSFPLFRHQGVRVEPEKRELAMGISRFLATVSEIGGGSLVLVDREPGVGSVNRPGPILEDSADRIFVATGC